MFGDKTTKTSSSDPASPAYTPTHADASVITAGLAGFRPGENKPENSTVFKSLIGGAGGLGRKADLARRTLIGGAK